MKKVWAALLVFVAASCAPCCAAAPEDLVPQGSGLYDAVALLSADHLLPPGSPDATSLQGVTGRLYTRRELAELIRTVTNQPADPRAASALAFARNILAPELQDGPDLAASVSTPPVLTGFGEVEAGKTQASGLLGRARLLGMIGRDGAYTASL